MAALARNMWGYVRIFSRYKQVAHNFKIRIE